MHDKPRCYFLVEPHELEEALQPPVLRRGTGQTRQMHGQMGKVHRARLNQAGDQHRKPHRAALAQPEMPT